MTDEPTEALRRLEQRLNEATDAAERLIAGASQHAAGERPPPAGWQKSGSDRPRSTATLGSEIELLVQAVQGLRELIPPEVLERLSAALRELLRALRGLIDFYLQRLESPRTQAPEVKDIPID